MISGGNGQAERMTVVPCITKMPSSSGRAHKRARPTRRLRAVRLREDGDEVRCRVLRRQEICARMRRTPAEDDCSFLIWKRPISEVLFTCGPPQNSSDTSPIL